MNSTTGILTKNISDQQPYILNIHRVVRDKPNHILVNLISSKVRCVLSTSKLATKGPQRSVLTDNEANRTKVNIKRTTNSRLFRSGWFALYERFSKANRRCLQTEPGGWSDADWARVRDRILGRLQDDSVVIGGDNKRSCTGLETLQCSSWLCRPGDSALANPRKPNKMRTFH